MKKYSKLILRIHGTTIIIAGTILTVIGWVGTFAGTGGMKVLQTEPLSYLGLFQAYLLIAALGVALWVGSFSVYTRPWHIIGFLAHVSPFMANIIFWDTIAEYGITHSGLILHAGFMLTEFLSFAFYNGKGSISREIMMNMRINWGRWMVIATLLTGIVLHATRLVVRLDAFQEIFTASLDAIFTIPIVLGIIGIVKTWQFIQFRGRLEKGVAIFTLAYFTISMPLHFQTWFTGNIDYIVAFPWWYSLVFIGYSSVLLVVWSRLRIQISR